MQGQPTAPGTQVTLEGPGLKFSSPYTKQQLGQVHALPLGYSTSSKTKIGMAMPTRPGAHILARLEPRLDSIRTDRAFPTTNHHYGLR